MRCGAAMKCPAQADVKECCWELCAKLRLVLSVQCNYWL